LNTQSTLGTRPRNGKATTRSSNGNKGTTPSAPANGEVDAGIIHDLCEIFKMLSDQSRLKILLALAQNGEMHVSALVDLLGQSQPAVSHHLSLMRFSRLVDCKRDGKHNFYRLDSARVGFLLEHLFGEIGNGMNNGSKQLHFEDFALSFKKK
jgi:DNA-binding transcriptional ArsR family regulator